MILASLPVARLTLAEAEGGAHDPLERLRLRGADGRHPALNQAVHERRASDRCDERDAELLIVRQLGDPEEIGKEGGRNSEGVNPLFRPRP
jgi:hypothetical protein